MNNQRKMPDTRNTPPQMDFGKIQREQQQKEFEKQKLISETMQKDFTAITNLISEDDYEKMKEFVLPCFSRMPASKL